MTIDEAIAEIKESGLYGNQVHQETLELALTALREQAEREKGCEHCRGWDTRCGAKYCPMCGRKLKEV